MNYMGQNDLYNILEEFLLMKPVIKRFTVQNALYGQVYHTAQYVVCQLLVMQDKLCNKSLRKHKNEMNSLIIYLDILHRNWFCQTLDAKN